MLFDKAEIRQQRGERRAVLDAPGEFCLARLDGLLLKALHDHRVHRLDKHRRAVKARRDDVEDALDVALR